MSYASISFNLSFSFSVYKYLLVNLVSKRVKEMDETGHYQMKDREYVSKKNIGRTLEEVSKQLIHLR